MREVYSNRRDVYPLTQKGRQQAEALADALKDTPFAALYCSPILRAVQTAELVGQRLGLAPTIEEGLREYDVGVLEGQSYDAATQAAYWGLVEAWLQRGEWDARLEGGESYRDVQERFMPFIRDVEAQFGSGDAHILAISHGGILRCMLPLLLGNVDNAFALAHPVRYATRVVAALQNGEWACLQWGDDVLVGEADARERPEEAR